MEPASSWMLIRFVSCCSTTGTPRSCSLWIGSSRQLEWGRFLSIFSIFFFFFFFFWLHPQQVEVPRPGTEHEPQQWPELLVLVRSHAEHQCPSRGGISAQSKSKSNSSFLEGAMCSKTILFFSFKKENTKDKSLANSSFSEEWNERGISMHLVANPKYSSFLFVCFFARSAMSLHPRITSASSYGFMGAEQWSLP